MKKFIESIYKFLGAEIDEEEEEAEKLQPEDKEKTSKIKPLPNRLQKEKSTSRNVILILMNPSIRDDARRAVSLLKENNLILADFESGNADRSILSYFVAYLSGAVDALGGVADKFGEYVYLFTPPGISITRDQKKDIIDSSTNISEAPFLD